MTDEKALKELIKAYKDGRIVLRDPADSTPFEDVKPQPQPATVERGIKATDEEIRKVIGKKFPSFVLNKVSNGVIYGSDSTNEIDIENLARVIYRNFEGCHNVNLDGSTMPKAWLSKFFN